MTNDIFAGILDVVVPEQAGLTGAQRRLIQESFGDGQDLPQKTRFACSIAEALNDTIKEGIEVDGTTYLPNPKSKAQFGKNHKGLPYLTVGLIDLDDGARYTLTWEGGAVPVQMAVIALKHDQGKRAETVSISLPLGHAKVHETGYKNGVKQTDHRRNHDTGPDGKPYPRAERRTHNRLCADDVRKMRRGGRRRNPELVGDERP